MPSPPPIRGAGIGLGRGLTPPHRLRGKTRLLVLDFDDRNSLRRTVTFGYNFVAVNYNAFF